MQKKSLALCGFTLIMGIFGAFFRWIQTYSVFDPETGLAQPNAFWSFAVAFFLIIVAVALVFWVRSLRSHSFPGNYSQALAMPSPIIKIGSAVVLILMLAGSVLSLVSFVREYQLGKSLGEALKAQTVFYLATAVLSLICGICLFFYLRGASSVKAKPLSGKGASTYIVVFLCYWLVAAYKYSASDPVVWHFAPHLLAISAIMLSFYYLAGFSFNQPKPLFALYFSLLGAFMGIVTIADSLPGGEKLLMCGFSLSLLLCSYATVRNAGTAIPAGEAALSENQTPPAG